MRKTLPEREFLLPLPAVRFLNRKQAAAYLGVGAPTFDAEVRSGMWPAPMKRGDKSTALTWDRKLLDRAADIIGGLIEAPAAAASQPAEGEISRLWDINDLATYLRAAPASISTRRSRDPDSLPPPIRRSGRPLWDPASVKASIAARGGGLPRKKAGRPRNF